MFLSSTTSSRFVGEVSEAQDSVHQPAAVGTRKPVQGQQVPFQTQTF